ncbi:MAG: helix-turn-helix domain-containing protein [Blastomonas sp.]
MARDTISTGSQVLDDIAEVIGMDAVLELSWRFRGQDVYVPKDLSRAPAIVQAIGRDAAELLSEHFHGTTLPIARRAGERAMVRRLSQQGHTKRQIADRLGIGERQVYRILAERDDRQMSLSL